MTNYSQFCYFNTSSEIIRLAVMVLSDKLNGFTANPNFWFMTTRSPFKYFKTSPEIIRLAVMYYVRYPLSCHWLTCHAPTWCECPFCGNRLKHSHLQRTIASRPSCQNSEDCDSRCVKPGEGQPTNSREKCFATP